MADSAPQFSLAVGDRVVYPNQGVCRVFGVDTKEVAGQRLTFISMRREEDGAVVMVPTTKVQSIGLRRLATRDEVGKIFTFLKSESDKADLDWKQRARTNVDRMTQGGLQGLAEVVKGLQVLSELRPLPTKERELYDNARHLLVSEMAASLSISECDAEDAIDLVLSPPGRERPKRTAEEFKQIPTAEEEELELGGDILSLGGDGELDLAAEEEAEEAEGSEGEADEEEQAAPARGARATGGGKAQKLRGTPGSGEKRAAKGKKPPSAPGKRTAERKPRAGKHATAPAGGKSKRKVSAARPTKASGRRKK
ncbi:MAG TPA: CarD family transcriptional regulator [Myxococcaceae bacterium]|nr:CarD family transcriptional regulator [Myxococcaceae bacterium]